MPETEIREQEVAELPLRARRWFVLARRKLLQGKADEVLADIEAALALEVLPDSARKALTNLYNFEVLLQGFQQVRIVISDQNFISHDSSARIVGVDKDMQLVFRWSKRLLRGGARGR